jgi:cytosine/adenosine deaminase-related metal-dependent hydrolase
VPELLIEDVTVLTMDAERRTIPHGWISVADNRIEAVGQGEPPPAEGARRIRGRGGLAMPGLISTHQHVIDSLLRGGLEQDRDLVDWLINALYGGLSAYTPEDCRLAATLTVTEALRAGVTTLTDNWGVNNGDDPARVAECAEATLETYKSTGIRVMFAPMMQDVFPDYWAGLATTLRWKNRGSRLDPATLTEDTDHALGRVESLLAAHHGSENGRIRICPAPILVQTASPQVLLGALELARRFDTIVTIHNCESARDAQVFTESGRAMSSTDYLNALGFLDERVLAAHCVWLDDRDLRLFKVCGAKVAHCPSSNSVLASGVAPVSKMVLAGIPVGLGTDNMNANCNVSILREMRHAVLLQKAVTLDPGALTAEKAVEMATIDGARALGLEDELGSIEASKKADIIVLDTDRPHWYPRHHIASVLVYQAQSDDVCTVIVDGRVVMEDRVLSHLPPDAEPAFYAGVQKASDDIIKRAGLETIVRRGWQSESRI